MGDSGQWPAIEASNLSGDEVRMMAAIAELCCCPDPGTEARAVRYVDERLNGPLRRFRPAYREGLQALDGACRQESGRSFLELSCNERAAFLERLHRGHKLLAFVTLVRAHLAGGADTGSVQSASGGSPVAQDDASVSY